MTPPLTWRKWGVKKGVEGEYKFQQAEDNDRWKLIGSLFEEELECLEIFLVGDKCVKGLAICGKDEAMEA